MRNSVDSNLEYCGGAPRLRGTRLPIISLLHRLDGDESITELLDPYADLSERDVFAALEYCAKRLCRANAKSLCFGCSLRSANDEGSFEDYLDEIGPVETKETGIDLETPGAKFLGTIDELREEWEGIDSWELAEAILKRLRPE